MVENKDAGESRENADVDARLEQHQQISGEWISSVIDGIKEMNGDELARLQATLSLFRSKL